jgi:teichuronic acid biosynthesis glycosyltransferase TuaG
MSEMDLVSVVMPSYNSAPTLRESMESVLAQSHANLELLVVDDGSSDASGDIAEEIAGRDGRVRVVRSPRRGVVDARNLATREARGRFIAFCDSDDLWTPDKLSRQLSFMRDRGSSISATSFRRIDEEGSDISGPVDLPGTIRYEDLLATNYVCCATVVYDVRMLGKLYMRDYRELGRLPLYMRMGRPKPLHEDYIAWADILSRGGAIDVLGEPLACYRVRRASHSGRKGGAAIARWYINGNVLGIPLHRNLVLFSRYAICAVWRRVGWRLRTSRVG